MATYADFKEFKQFDSLDQLDMLAIYLTWDRYKQYHKMEFKEYLKDCCEILNEIELDLEIEKSKYLYI